MSMPDLFPGGFFENFQKKENYDGISHSALRERLRKTLHYGKMPTFDRPSLPMTEIAVELFQEAAPRELGRLDMRWAANISRCAVVSPCALMLAMLYIERLRHRDPHYLQHVASSDLFLISMMLASKYLYDEGVEEAVFNEEWAETAGLDVADINTLEREFLTAMDWKLFVGADEFWMNLLDLEKRVSRREWKKTGHFTYTDADVLTTDVRWSPLLVSLLKTLAEMWVVCGVAYVMGVVTLLATPTALSLAHFTLDHAPSTLTTTVTPPIDLEMTNDTLADSTTLPNNQLTPPTPVLSPPTDWLTPPIDPINPPIKSAQSLLSLSLITDTMLAFVVGKTEKLDTDCEKCSRNTECLGLGSCDFSSRCLHCRLHASSVPDEPKTDPNWNNGANIRREQCTFEINRNLASELLEAFGEIQLGSQTTSAG